MIVVRVAGSAVVGCCRSKGRGLRWMLGDQGRRGLLEKRSDRRLRLNGFRYVDTIIWIYQVCIVVIWVVLGIVS